MKDKILKLKDDLQKLHNYEQDKIELKRIKDTLQMYVDIVFPKESEDWHSKIFNIQFLPHPISDGYLGIMIPPDKGEFQQGKQSLSNVIDLIIEKMEIVEGNNSSTDSNTNCDNKRVFIVHGHDNETKDKAEALQCKLHELNKESKHLRYVGGIVAKRDGLWYFNQKDTYIPIEKNRSDWMDFAELLK